MPLTNDERQKFHAWYAQHGKTVTAIVHSQLTQRARTQGATSTSIVTQSIWRSLIENHRQRIDPTDDLSAIKLLTQLAYRHTNTINCRERRRPFAVSLDLSVDSNQSEGSGQTLSSELRDWNALPPEFGVTLNRLVYLLLDSVDNSIEIAIPWDEADQLLELVLRMDPIERTILAMKLADCSLVQIAYQLQRLDPGINQFDVSRIWRRIRDRADSPDANSAV